MLSSRQTSKKAEVEGERDVATDVGVCVDDTVLSSEQRSGRAHVADGIVLEVERWDHRDAHDHSLAHELAEVQRVNP